MPDGGGMPALIVSQPKCIPVEQRFQRSGGWGATGVDVGAAFAAGGMGGASGTGGVPPPAFGGSPGPIRPAREGGGLEPPVTCQPLLPQV